MPDNKSKIKRIMDRRRFVGLMDLYDRNFALIHKLIPDLALLPENCVTGIKDYPDLYLNIQERCKFTTMLNLTYWFPLPADQNNKDDKGEVIADPDLDIRIYHDARVVEAMSCKPKGFMSIDKESIGEQQHLDCRWDSNVFLNKWLEYMVNAGYEFSLDKIRSEKIESTKILKDSV